MASVSACSRCALLIMGTPVTTTNYIVDHLIALRRGRCRVPSLLLLLPVRTNELGPFAQIKAQDLDGRASGDAQRLRAEN